MRLTHVLQRALAFLAVVAVTLPSFTVAASGTYVSCRGGYADWKAWPLGGGYYWSYEDGTFWRDTNGKENIQRTARECAYVDEQGKVISERWIETLPDTQVQSSEDTGAREDSDDDGLSTDEEQNVHLTDPLRADTDSDGLTDSQEIRTYQTNPLHGDTDRDSLGDGNEVFQLGTDPNSPDTDGDGLKDASDASPNRESVPPTSRLADVILSYDERGYIDLYVLEPNPSETTSRSVLLAGSLTVVHGGDIVPVPLRFILEATPGSKGLWSTRFVAPPGVDAVTGGSVRIIVTDNALNTAAIFHTFNHSLGGPRWSEMARTADPQGEWATIMEHAGDATDSTAPAFRASLMGDAPRNSGEVLEPRQQEEKASPRVWTYRYSGQAATISRVTLSGATMEIIEGGFLPVEPAAAGILGDWSHTIAQAFSSGAAMTVSGFKATWADVVPPTLSAGRTVMEETWYQTGSVLLGSDSEWAQGRMTGDIVTGFFLYGDIRDCLLRPLYTDTTDLANIAVISLACTGLGIDLAQATPGAPVAVAANGVTSTLKVAAKAAAKEAPGLVPELVRMGEICARELGKCVAVGVIAKHAIDNPGSARTLERLTKALGTDDVVTAVARNEALLARLTRVSDDLVAKLGEEAAQAALRNAYRPSRLGDAPTTLEKLTELHKAYADHPGAKESAAEMFANTAKFAHVEGAEDFVKVARSQANPKDADGWEGYFFEAQQYARLTEEVDLVAISQHRRFTDDLGRNRDVQPDAFIATDEGLLLTEIKRGDIRGPRDADKPGTKTNVDQLRTQAEYIRAQSAQENLAKKIDWRIGGKVYQSFRQGADEIAAEYGIRIRLLDPAGREITTFPPDRVGGLG